MHVCEGNGCSSDSSATCDVLQDPKSIRKMLQRKRRKRYQPMLDRISEATNSALER